MKKILFTGLVSVITLAFAGCSADDPFASTATGGLEVDLIIDQDVASAKGSRAEYTDVTVDDLKLRLIDSEGTVVKEGGASDFTSDQKFKVGDYTLEAEYGSDEQDGFETPHFFGTTTVTVRDNEVTGVSLTASLANAMLELSYTDAFKSYFTSYSASVLSAASRTTTFLNEETRAAYITPGLAKVFVDVTKPNGLSATLQPAEFEAQARHLYRVSLDVNGGEVGSPTLVITFDETLGLEPIEIELSDELMNAPAPEMTLKGATVDPTTGEAVVEVVDGVAYDGELSLSIVARGGIKNVPMVTVSNVLASEGWPSEVDLVAATTAQQSLFKQLGLSVRGLWQNPDKMAVIDFAGLLPSLRYSASGSNENRFTIYVKDAFTKVSEPITLVVSVNPSTLELSNGNMREGADYMTATLTYNGSTEPTLNANVDIQIKNDRGTWTSTTYTYTAANATRAMESPVYTLRINLPSDAKEGAEGYELRALRSGSSAVAATIVVKPVPQEFAISAASADVWATKAIVAFSSNLEGTTAETLASGATLLIKAVDADDYTTATVEKTIGSNMVTIKGLTSGKTYSVKGYIMGDSSRECSSITITTESALQLPNSDMETWCQPNSGNNWELLYPGSTAADSAWGTNNPMTTSQGSDLAYCRISGTISTTDCHGGSAAALIRTVGWGSGNTATSTDGSKGVTKYVDAGLLHLGASRSSRPSGYSDREGALTTDDLSCGLTFASRPASLSFWYKYSPKNSADKGVAEVYLYDGSGNLLASGTADLTSAGSYTQVTLPFTYSVTSAKAAKIYVKFLSTNDRSFLEKTSDNLSGPGFANLSRGTYMGSQLYIDDLSLNY